MTSVATPVGDQLGGDRLAAGRQLVDHRDIEVGIESHRQGSRYRRRAHHQLMRQQPVAALAQGEALGHAETVLLVDDRQRHPVEHHRLLDQRVRADQQVDLAGRDRLPHLLLGARRQRAGEPADPDRLRPTARAASLSRCCCARISVGAISAAWWPEPIACIAARAAITVLPLPTSPCSSRFIGWWRGEVGADLRPDPLLGARQA